jgi:thioredoxin reductase (NADPH)
VQNKVYPVCVIGGGSAGTMATLRTVLNNDECLFFPGSPKDKKRSRALWVRKIENMPAHLGYKRGITEPNDETIRWISESAFASKLHQMKNTGVVEIRKNAEDVFEITDNKGQQHLARYVVLCTGVMDVQPVIAGSIETVFDYANAQTIDYCLICDGHHVLNKKTSVIGHSDSAGWVSIMLYERYRSMNFTVLTNGEKPQFKPETRKLMETYGIKIAVAPIRGIIGEEKGNLLKGFELENGEKVDADICFVSLGMIVYNELAKQLGAELDDRGFVKTQDSGESSVPGLYVAGDLRANTKKQIYTAWDTAVSAVNSINLKIRAEKRKELF